MFIHRGGATDPGRPLVLHLDLKGFEPAAAARRQPAALLVLDARGMRADCRKAAFAEVQRLRRSASFRHGVLVSDRPEIPLIVAAIRAGLSDVVHEPLSARQLARLLRDNVPAGHHTAHHFTALAATIRALGAPSRSPSEQHLARREAALLRRTEELQNQETRLSLERAALDEREQRLRASTRRFERDFAAMQKDIDLMPATAVQSAPPFRPELDGLAARLAERSKALDIRERMLQKMENILLGQLHGQPVHPLEVDTRPPFPMGAARDPHAA